MFAFTSVYYTARFCQIANSLANRSRVSFGIPAPLLVSKSTAVPLGDALALSFVVSDGQTATSSQWSGKCKSICNRIIVDWLPFLSCA